MFLAFPDSGSEVFVHCATRRHPPHRRALLPTMSCVRGWLAGGRHIIADSPRACRPRLTVAAAAPNGGGSMQSMRRAFAAALPERRAGEDDCVDVVVEKNVSTVALAVSVRGDTR